MHYVAPTELRKHSAHFLSLGTTEFITVVNKISIKNVFNDGGRFPRNFIYAKHAVNISYHNNTRGVSWSSST